MRGIVNGEKALPYFIFPSTMIIIHIFDTTTRVYVPVGLVLILPKHTPSQSSSFFDKTRQKDESLAVMFLLLKRMPVKLIGFHQQDRQVDLKNLFNTHNKN